MSETEEVKGGRRALGKLAQVLSRADEIGGEVRDRLTQKYAESERAQRVVARLQQLRGKKHQPIEVRKAAPAPATAAEEMAGDVPRVQRTGLGDPEVAAQVFGRSSCPWSGRAIRMLEDRKVDYDFIDLDDPDNGSLETPLVGETKQNTVPYIYLRGQFVGGYNALAEVDRLGQLQYAIMDAAEREANPAAQKVVIIPRPNSDESAPGEQGEPPE